MYDRNRLLQLVKEKALQFGEFKLASGKTASYYLDCRKLTLDGEGVTQVAEGMLDLLQRDGLPDVVGGMAIGADPITAAILCAAWRKSIALRGFIARKESKAHGTGKWIEGPIRAGDRAVIVEDVVTTGGSSLRAIELAREAGLEVVRCLAIVDRLQGARDRFSEIGVDLECLLTIKDLGLE